jgi:hypothetical protein
MMPCSRCSAKGLFCVVSESDSRACEACICANVCSSCKLTGVLLSECRFMREMRALGLSDVRAIC